MDTILGQHLDLMLTKYTGPDYWDSLVGAKKLFTQLTGSVIDEDKGFESRMNSFNDWYLFNYPFQNGMPLSKIYTSPHDISDEVDCALSSVMYSLFEYSKDNFKGKMVLRDILHGEDFILEDKTVGLVEGDVFTGRLITLENRNYLLNGIVIVPSGVKKILNKTSRKVRKTFNIDEEAKYLYKIESLSTKASRYNHVDPAKIFAFD